MSWLRTRCAGGRKPTVSISPLPLIAGGRHRARAAREHAIPRRDSSFPAESSNRIQPSVAQSWSFPEPFGTQEIVEVPLTETILIARHLHVVEAHNYLNRAPLRDLSDPATPGPVAADEHGRSNQRFLIDVIVRNGDEERHVTTTGRDIYAISAPIVVEAIERVCVGSHKDGGTFALGQLVDASAFLHALPVTAPDGWALASV